MAANEKKTIAELQKQLNQIQASTNLNDKEKESAAKRIAQAIKEQRVETELLLKSTQDVDFKKFGETLPRKINNIR